MKKLAIISIALLALSGSVLASLDDQQATETQANEKQPVISVSMIKEAFKFGFQSGWLQSEDDG